MAKGKIGSVFFSEHKGSWLVRVPDPRTGKRIERRAKTSREGEELRARLISEIRSGGTALSKRDQTLEQYYNHWFNTYVLGKLKGSSVQDYRSKMDKWVVPYIGRLRLREIRNSDIQRHVDFVAKEASPQRARSCRTVLNACLNQAVADDVIVKNPAKKLRLPKVRAKEMDFYQPKEVNRVIGAAKSHRFGAAFVVAATMGLRAGELLALKWSNIDLAGKKMSIRESISEKPDSYGVHRGVRFESPKTENAIRTITIGSSALTALREHKLRTGGVGKDGLVFHCKNGNPVAPTDLWSYWRSFCSEHGLPLYPVKSLRHTAASIMLKSGCDWKQLKSTLGHSTVAFTIDQYGHMLEDERDTVASGVDRVLREASTA